MNDFKSKLPDFKEVTSMASKLFKDVKKSVCEIIDDYKKNRAEEAATETKEADVKADKKSAAQKEEVEVAEVNAKKKAPTKAKPPKNDDSE